MAVYYVDIDQTICRTPGDQYELAEPIPERIAVVNRLYDAGHRVVYWTARGATKPRGEHARLMALTRKQLGAWGCRHHECKFDKPFYDFFIEDKAAWWGSRTELCPEQPSDDVQDID